MKAEQARKLADEALQQLDAALQQGRSDVLTAHLAMVAKFHRYSFGNIMLIATQRPDASRVAGFNTWKRLGRFVKKGEKGIVIIAPLTIRRSADNGNPSDEDATILRFKAVRVFDVSQTGGEPLCEPPRVGGNPNGATDRLKAFVHERNITLEHAADLGSADGVSHGGRIVLREGLPPAEEFATLVHELAHELLHHGNGDERPPKTVRETEAEAVAFIVSQAIGLDTNTAASDYIQLYRGDADTLAASLDRIQRTATAIIQAVSEDGER